MIRQRRPRTAAGTEPAPPEARREPCEIVTHGETRQDEYRWMSRRDDPAVRAYLEANNTHAELALAHTAALRRRLVAELAARVPFGEGPPPWRQEGWVYRLRHPRNREHPEFVRWRPGRPGCEERLLDANRLAQDHAVFKLGKVAVAPGGVRFAYTCDTRGDCTHTLTLLDVATRRPLPKRPAPIDGAFEWAADGRAVFFCRLQPRTLRPWRVCRWAVAGPDAGTERVIYTERDPAFRCLLGRSRSGRFLLLTLFAIETEEVLLLDLADEAAGFRRLCPRTPGHIYDVDHATDDLVVRTNHRAPGFRVCTVPLAGGASDPGSWREVLPAQDDCYIEQAAAVHGHVAVIERREAVPRVRLVSLADGAVAEVDAASPPGERWFDRAPDDALDCVRYAVASLKTPTAYHAWDCRRGRRKTLAAERMSGYRQSAYAAEQHWIVARDGTRIPVAVVYRRAARRPGGNPLLLLAYGAYGTIAPRCFDEARLSLLDRGVVYGIVHVRGGGALGPRWHAAGRGPNALRSAHDFVDAAEGLLAQGLARPGALLAESYSAGGVLLGCVLNLRPDLLAGVVLDAPFVDVLNSMSDAMLPLTACEYEEWGDPRDPEQWRAMRNYSPYDNVRPAAYPHVLALAYLNDAQVPYWEPAKWIARLRAANAAGTRLLLKTAFGCGHSGPAGRSARRRHLAFIQAFLLDAVGLGQAD